jgi:hypothetical protein
MDLLYASASIRRSCVAPAAGLILNSQLSYGALLTESGVSATAVFASMISPETDSVAGANGLAQFLDFEEDDVAERFLRVVGDADR